MTVTFGDCAENHAGMQKLGAAAPAGLTYRELLAAQRLFEASGCDCEMVDLVAAARVEDAFGDSDPDDAEVLIVRGGVEALLRRAHPAASAADLEAEHAALDHDTQALMRGRVVNKLARHNLCFADVSQEPNYEAGQGRVVDFANVPLTAALRDGLQHYFGPKAASLYAEGNYYYDATKCGIGFHGDTERRIVIAARLGTPIPLHYQWFHRSAPVGHRVALALGNGDLYAMSSKAVGFDWKRPSIPTLRHAAGARKYLTIAGHAAAADPVRL